ncbi:MAG: hypothetical protein QM754_17510 [Tepidisphaeraceae bacterium]
MRKDKFFSEEIHLIPELSTNCSSGRQFLRPKPNPYRLVVLLAERAVAEHGSSYGHGELVLNPSHYLAALSSRLGA